MLACLACCLHVCRDCWDGRDGTRMGHVTSMGLLAFLRLLLESRGLTCCPGRCARGWLCVDYACHRMQTVLHQRPKRLLNSRTTVLGDDARQASLVLNLGWLLLFFFFFFFFFAFFCSFASSHLPLCSINSSAFDARLYIHGG